MNKLLALADRVEKLTGPDREVDEAIGQTVPNDVAWAAFNQGFPCWPKSGWAKFTDSIDAAMTLVPPSWGWQLSQTGVAGAWLISDGQQPITVGGITFPGVTAQVRAEAISPALALTCAALRARAHGGGEG